MLEKIKSGFERAVSGLTAEVSKFRNRSFMEAIVASCALVAAADGTISKEEKEKMLGFLINSDSLKHFDVNEVNQYFTKITSKIESDSVIGKAEALQVIGKLRGKEDQSRLLIRVACAIGEADGNFDPDEKAVVQEICRDLGLNPNDFQV